jgi:hypothetical protein
MATSSAFGESKYCCIKDFSYSRPINRGVEAVFITIIFQWAKIQKYSDTISVTYKKTIVSDKISAIVYP